VAGFFARQLDFACGKLRFRDEKPALPAMRLPVVLINPVVVVVIVPH